jgi:hypothetical protein
MDKEGSPPQERDHAKGPVTEWKQKYGEPLENALRWIARWRMEARCGVPREITYQEFYFRATGALTFDGDAYVMSDGVADVIANSGMPGLLWVSRSPKSNSDFGTIPRLSYELARHIVRTNKAANVQLPECLQPFAEILTEELPRGRGGDNENRILFRTLACWGVSRAVKFGLKPGKNRFEAIRPHKQKTLSGAELVADVFCSSGLGHFGTYNSINEAWQALRHEGKNQRKLAVKSNADVYEYRFYEIDEQIKGLPPYSDPEGQIG